MHIQGKIQTMNQARRFLLRNFNYPRFRNRAYTTKKKTSQTNSANLVVSWLFAFSLLTFCFVCRYFFSSC